MSTATDEFDDLGNPVEGKTEGGALREQNKKLAKQLADAQKALADIQAKARTSDLKSLLKEAGAKESLARWAASDIEGDPTKENVLAWLQENGDTFGWKPADPAANDQRDPGRERDENGDFDDANAADAARRDAARRIRQATDRAPETQTGITLEKLKYGSDKELLDLGVLTYRD